MMNWNPPRWVPLTKNFFQSFFLTNNFFFQEQKKSFQETTFVQFFMYWKAKENFGAIRKFLKIFIFGNLHHKKGLKGGISFDSDSGPPRYVIWCCGVIGHQVLTFFQIGCGHTVSSELPANLSGQFSLSGQIYLYLATATLKGLVQFQNKKFETIFHQNS